MMRTGLFTLLMLALASMFVLTGCPEAPTEQLPAVDPNPPVDAEPVDAEPVDVEPVAEEAADTVAAPTEFEWTEAPTLDMIPGGAVAGVINGKPFTAATVRLKQDDENTVLEITDASVDEPTGLVMSDTGVDLRFTLEPGQPGEFVVAKGDKKDFDREHTYYHYPRGGDKGPMSVNTDWGCAGQITEWTLQADEEDEDILGNAKGKVVVIFNDDEKSWVAGNFDCVYYTW